MLTMFLNSSSPKGKTSVKHMKNRSSDAEKETVQNGRLSPKVFQSAAMAQSAAQRYKGVVSEIVTCDRITNEMSPTVCHSTRKAYDLAVLEFIYSHP